MVACSASERLLRRRSPDSTTPNLQRPNSQGSGHWKTATLGVVIFAVFVFQKSIWALNFMKRACNTLFGRSHVSVVGTKVWLYVRTAAEFVML